MRHVLLLLPNFVYRIYIIVTIPIYFFHFSFPIPFPFLSSSHFYYIHTPAFPPPRQCVYPLWPVRVVLSAEVSTWKVSLSFHMRPFPTGVLTVLVYAAFAVFLAPPAAAIGVVSIDYGTEWIKAALVKPGMPFDVVLSRDSKRKVQASAAFKGKVPADGNLARQERLLGSDAYAYASRDPLQSFHAAKLLLGQSCNASFPRAVEMYRDVFGNDVVPLSWNSTGSSCVLRPSPESEAFWRPEEIVGMELDHIRELAEDTAGEMLSIGVVAGSQGYFGAQRGLDTVITVPIFFTALERQALMDSALLAGFRPHMISDGAAAAVNYVQSRSFPKPERHIFFDVGSGASRASLVELSEKPAPEAKGKVLTDVRVVDAAWEREAGGLALDMLVRDLLVEQFDKQHGAAIQGSVKSDKRAMARLLREANRVKHVLSANAAAVSNVESLTHDIDFRASIEREAFEAAMKSAGLLDRITSPLTELLQRTKRTMNDIDSVVLIGGSTRVPAVHAALRAAGIPDAKLAVNVNADEAAVMGAAAYGATMQPSLRMKQVSVTDGNMYAVDMSDVSTQQHTTIFPAGPREHEQFHYEVEGADEDFGVTLSYAPESLARLPNGEQGPLMHVQLEGISAVLGELRAANELKNVDVLVNATISTSPPGVYTVHNANLKVTPKTTVAGALKNFFKLSDEPAANATNATEPISSEKVESLTLDTRYLTRSVPLAGTDKLKSLERLRLIVHEAKQRVLKDTASNQLEATLYQARELLDDATFAPSVAASERKSILAGADKTAEYLAGAVEDASADEVQKRLRELNKLLEPAKRRVEQAAKRPAATTALRATLDEGTAFIQEAKANLTEALKASAASKYTAAELDSLTSQLDKDRKWLDDGERAQASRKADQDAVLLAEDMDRRAKKVRDALTRLRRRRIPKTRPKKKESASASATESATESATATGSATESATESPASSTSTSATPEVPIHEDL